MPHNFRRSLRLFVSIAACNALFGCGSVIKENHYFATYKEGSSDREPVQFYRLSVDGSSNFSNARFLSGYFDERAGSLFFNELQRPTGGRLFDDNVKLPGAGPGTSLQSLSPSAVNGSYVLILSTDVDSIASAIGSFAESQIVADSLTRLLNRDKYRAKASSDARVPLMKAQGTALATRVGLHLASAASAPTGAAAVPEYLRALTALAQSLGYGGDEFPNLKAAQDWFAQGIATAGSDK